MPFVVINHQKIHYELYGDRGPYLLLHGPILVTENYWQETGYIEQLESIFRIVALEPLGQGRSDAPEDPEAYSMDARIAHVLGVLQEMRVDYTHFIGVGLGAQVGFQMAVSHRQVIRTLNTMSAHAYPLIDELPLQEEGVALLQQGNLQGYLDRCRVDEAFAPEQLEQLAEGTPSAYAHSLNASVHWEGIGDHLGELSTPMQLITATSEPRFLSVRESGRQMRFGRYTILPEMKFDRGLWSAELVVPALLDYLRRQR